MTGIDCPFNVHPDHMEDCIFKNSLYLSRDINLIGEVRLLDQIVGRVKKLPKTDTKGNSGEYWPTVCSVIIHLLWQTHHVPKINRKLLQVLFCQSL